MGNYGGNLNANNIGTIPGTVGYIVYGGICPWAYGADVAKNPVEDPMLKATIQEQDYYGFLLKCQL